MTDCLFCRIVSGEIPATIVRRDDEIVAFRDINPQAPTHILVVPTRHIASTSEAEAGDAGLIGRLILAAADLAQQEGLQQGYRLVLNTGPLGGQTVDHLHVHLVGGRQMTWPPG
jgi:histidine triad (HIT) family protein